MTREKKHVSIGTFGSRHADTARETYDRVAADWARDVPMNHGDLIGLPVICELVREIGLVDTLVDLACGDGFLSRTLSSSATKLIGVDLSSVMLQEARRRSRGFRNIGFIQADLRHLGAVLRPSTVDIAIGMNAFCCIPNRESLYRVFKDVYETLRPGGWLIVQIPHPVDGLLRESSTWLRDVDQHDNYFGRGSFIRRRLRLIDGRWLPIARYHYPISDYVEALLSCGMVLRRFLEPVPATDILQKYPDLRREARLPSCLVLASQRLS